MKINDKFELSGVSKIKESKLIKLLQQNKILADTDFKKTTGEFILRGPVPDTEPNIVQSMIYDDIPIPPVDPAASFHLMAIVILCKMDDPEKFELLIEKRKTAKKVLSDGMADIVRHNEAIYRKAERDQYVGDVEEWEKKKKEKEKINCIDEIVHLQSDYDEAIKVFDKFMISKGLEPWPDELESDPWPQETENPWWTFSSIKTELCSGSIPLRLLNIGFYSVCCACVLICLIMSLTLFCKRHVNTVSDNKKSVDLKK